jgi:predicted RNA binding protein YcfA (HicA-like mRNA interferase family)
MKQVSGDDFCRMLKRHGWTLLRINGSHHIFGKPGNVARISVPVHGDRPLKAGLLRALMKAAGLDESNL